MASLYDLVNLQAGSMWSPCVSINITASASSACVPLQYNVLNTTDPAGITTVDGIPNNAICTFYGSYQHYEGEIGETDPVQCVMGQDVDRKWPCMVYVC